MLEFSSIKTLASLQFSGFLGISMFLFSRDCLTKWSAQQHNYFSAEQYKNGFTTNSGLSLSEEISQAKEQKLQTVGGLLVRSECG